MQPTSTGRAIYFRVCMEAVGAKGDTPSNRLIRLADRKKSLPEPEFEYQHNLHGIVRIEYTLNCELKYQTRYARHGQSANC